MFTKGLPVMLFEKLRGGIGLKGNADAGRCWDYQTGPPLAMSVYMSTLLPFDPAPSTVYISCLFSSVMFYILDIHIL
jgi:hypothetical protein